MAQLERSDQLPGHPVGLKASDKPITPTNSFAYADEYRYVRRAALKERACGRVKGVCKLLIHGTNLSSGSPRRDRKKRPGCFGDPARISGGISFAT
jgi:hypothetical protein